MSPYRQYKLFKSKFESQSLSKQSVGFWLLLYKGVILEECTGNGSYVQGLSARAGPFCSSQPVPLLSPFNLTAGRCCSLAVAFSSTLIARVIY